ncbi:MAG: hypothetical protein IKT40_11885 [Bacilli bacterium]|nr:hypothetical protein [Bacilli bacterium]
MTLDLKYYHDKLKHLKQLDNTIKQILVRFKKENYYNNEKIDPFSKIENELTLKLQDHLYNIKLTEDIVKDIIRYICYRSKVSKKDILESKNRRRKEEDKFKNIDELAKYVVDNIQTERIFTAPVNAIFPEIYNQRMWFKFYNANYKSGTRYLIRCMYFYYK